MRYSNNLSKCSVRTSPRYHFTMPAMSSLSPFFTPVKTGLSTLGNSLTSIMMSTVAVPTNSTYIFTSEKVFSFHNRLMAIEMGSPGI